MKGVNSNKGFSLVELIIVIAIMAILVGVMAPQLLKYIEKSKVSSDTQQCDAIRTAILCALADPNVLSADDKSKDWIKEFTNPGEDIHLYSGAYGGAWLNCEFVRSVTETLGYNPWATSNTAQGFKSTPGNGGIGLAPCAKVSDNGNNFAVYLAWSDRTGHKEGENFNGDYDELEDSKVIFVK